MITQPLREHLIIGLVAIALCAHLVLPSIDMALFAVAGLGSLPILIRAVRDLARFRISLDVFNLFAIAVSFATREAGAAAFIVLMIASADVLEWHTRQKTKNAVTELLRLKPQTALLERDGDLTTIPADVVRIGDIVVVEEGQSVPVDGIVVHGTAMVNEALVTGESLPVEKTTGARVLMSTVVESGIVKVRATHVGKDSTIEKMAELMRDAARNKSQPERLADRFAAIFLPLVILFGLGVYLVTRDIRMTAALFLVACADDMAVAIPLAMTASLGWAAKRGVIIKGGAWLHTLSRVRTLVLDKTGTLTYGNFRLERLDLEEGVREPEFWLMLGIAEKFSEHPIGRALYTQSRSRITEIPDPDEVTVHKGAGVVAVYDGRRIAVGDGMLAGGGDPGLSDIINARIAASIGTTVAVTVDGRFWGTVSLADIPRPEAASSLSRVRGLGIRKIIMFTGDNEQTARRVAQELGIHAVRAGMKPEDKLRELEAIPLRPVAMVGDGVNDAPALARADVGIAMGKGGTSIASEAADVIILTDDLRRLADIVLLGRKTISVIHWDIALWFISNAVGFALVLTGIAGPAFAAFYNFATDFLPLINSLRLFRSRA